MTSLLQRRTCGRRAPQSQPAYGCCPQLNILWFVVAPAFLLSLLMCCMSTGYIYSWNLLTETNTRIWFTFNFYNGILLRELKVELLVHKNGNWIHHTQKNLTWNVFSVHSLFHFFFEEKKRCCTYSKENDGEWEKCYKWGHEINSPTLDIVSARKIL